MIDLHIFIVKMAIGCILHRAIYVNCDINRMDVNDVTAWVDANMPETILIIGGLLSICIAVSYAADKDSWRYKLFTALGFIIGIIMAFTAYTRHGDWKSVTVIFVSVVSFALIIRPLREVHFSVILALLVMGIIYTLMGDLSGNIGSFDLSTLSTGYPRIIVAFIAGAFVYMILHFAEAIVLGVGKVMNWWPILFILGLVCIIEGVLMLSGYGSITDYIDTSSIGSVL